eukprot:SAG31_NODE_20100_length_583_cov_8.416422_1_plen_133_part_01
MVNGDKTTCLPCGAGQGPSDDDPATCVDRVVGVCHRGQCGAGQFCGVGDLGNNCYFCADVTQSNCPYGPEAYGGGCCSREFLTSCPEDPHGCVEQGLIGCSYDDAVTIQSGGICDSPDSCSACQLVNPDPQNF